MECLRERIVQARNGSEHNSVETSPLILAIEAIYELDELFPICFSKGVNWEIFWNNPGMPNRIGANEIQPMSMSPNTMLIETIVIL